MNGRFLIYLRHRQNQAQIPAGVGPVVNVVVQCNPITGFAEYAPGNVDNTWYDFTNFIENAEKLSFTWDKINSGNSTNSTTNPDGSNYDKALTSDLMFFDDAFKFIYDWLLKDDCQILNAIEVKIVDLIAGGTYRLFEIKNDNIEYAPVDEPCQFRIKLREQDTTWHCIHRTVIFDNWQNWFEDSAVKEHPCFLTCIEPRPRLVQSARMGLLLFIHSMPVIAGVDAIVSNSITDDARRILNANRFVDSPLVRTYIENVAGKCGLEMDTIFDEGKQWDKLCIYYPQAGYMHESNDDAILSPSLAYHFDNRWLITIAELLDKLKMVFAAEWYVTPNNTIVFKHTKDLVNLLPIYDFTLPTATPIYDLRYTFNGDKKPAYGRYEYQPDGSDLASQEISTLYNDIVDYDGPASNPMLEGERAKNFEFAPTGFVRDGRAKDYMDLLIDDGTIAAKILLAIIAVVTAALLLGVLSVAAGAVLAAFFVTWNVILNGKNNTLQDEFRNNPVYSGAVRLTSEQVLTPRLILWDGESKTRAKAVVEPDLPTPNVYYNTDSTAYNVKNKINQDNTGLKVYNYPLYFDGDFTDNLFDKYHDPIDNPLKSKQSHQDAKWNVDLCEDMQNLFGVFENQYAVIGKIVKLETRDNYDVFARISNINVDHGANLIYLKGAVIRRLNSADEIIACSTFMINSRCLIINGSYININ
jgi:hypothetical protein